MYRSFVYSSAILLIYGLSLSYCAAAEIDAEKPASVQITPELLESMGYVKKNRFSATSFQITPRRPAPAFNNAFAVIDEKFERISLSDYSGKWVILLFYPFDFTFVCPTEILSYSENIAEFRSINSEVLAISTDSHHTHLAWIKTPRDKGGLGQISIPVIADISKQISQDYGVLVTDEDDDMYGAALRGLFIIDPIGKIRSLQINDDQVGRNVDETLRTLKGFQYADSHPQQVCPANWKPGGATITADQEKKLDFFGLKYSD